MYHLFKSNQLITELSALGPNGMEIFREQLPDYIKFVQGQSARDAKVGAESYTFTTFADLADLSIEHVVAFQQEIPLLVKALKNVVKELAKNESIANAVPHLTFIPGTTIAVDNKFEAQDAESS